MSSGVVFEPPAFDTLGAALELENAGFARQQAEALAKTIARAHTAAATPQDIANAVSELKQAIAALGDRVKAVEAKQETLATKEALAKLEAQLEKFGAELKKMATKEDLANLVTHDQLAAALAKQKNELLVWMFSFGLGIAALSITITQLLD
ncbi:MAG: hypothetical protein OXU78_05335 [Deltaproteobacteria bacterium]|nr:hypothetical protein [Deltaproteobacteria bacterium]